MYDAFSNGTSFVSSTVKGESVVDSTKEYAKSEEKGILLFFRKFSYFLTKQSLRTQEKLIIAGKLW
jgi:hypothetical protein